MHPEKAEAGADNDSGEEEAGGDPDAVRYEGKKHPEKEENENGLYWNTLGVLFFFYEYWQAQEGADYAALCVENEGG